MNEGTLQKLVDARRDYIEKQWGNAESGDVVTIAAASLRMFTQFGPALTMVGFDSLLLHTRSKCPQTGNDKAILQEASDYIHKAALALNCLDLDIFSEVFLLDESMPWNKHA